MALHLALVIELAGDGEVDDPNLNSGVYDDLFNKLRKEVEDKVIRKYKYYMLVFLSHICCIK